MINKLKPKSEFSRNVLTLMTGTTIAQAIPIAISPILTRLYTPEDFGIAALLIAVSSIFASISSARYELAIMLPRKNEDAINVLALGLMITIMLSIILLVLVQLFNDYFSKLLNNDVIGFWLYFIPLTVFLSGLFTNLSYFHNRRKKYKEISNTIIAQSIASAFVRLSLGFMKQGAAGLIIGQIVNSMVGNISLAKNIIKDKVLVSRISKVKMIALAKRYKNFPKYSIWAALANTLSRNMTNILVSTFFSVSTLGFYSLVQRILGMPSSLIGNAIGQVFFQQAAEEKKKTGKAINAFNSTIKKLIVIALPSFGILFFIVEDLFAFVFGEEWRVAGEYAHIIIPLFFIRFISSTVSSINIVFEKQKIGLYINLLLLLSVVTIFYYSSFMNLEFDSFLSIFTVILSVEYFTFLIYYRKLSLGVYN